MGLEIEQTNDEDIKIIKNSLGDIRDKFHKAWKVKSLKTQEKFDKFVNNNNIKERKLLWHGSRNENWWSIICNGLVLRPQAIITGKMFGYGIYFAPSSRKSLGYTSINGSYWVKGGSSSAFMSLYDVAYGKPFDAYSFENKFQSLDYKGLQQMCPGANCLHAHAGSMLRNDEIIVYQEEQLTIKYLVELHD
jgi:poly [ADP-ribose] polymerase